MKDRSKKLTVVNTDKRKPVTGPSTNENVGGGGTGLSFGGMSIGGGLDYLLKAVWDKVWEIKTDSQGNEYIFGKLPVVTQYGITMYAGGGELDLPSIYAGLPIDNSTLIRDDNGVLMINPDIDLGGGASTWDELIGKPSWIGSTKPSYNYSEILQTPDLSVYALAKDLEKYVTLNTEQTIAAHKNFLNGFSVGGLGITKSQDDVVYIDANLVVRGGITMYADNTVDVGSIYDGLPIDGTTIYWENDKLKANITEGVITNITSAMVVEALGYTPYNASNPKGYISGITSDMVVSALGYTPLQNHQTIYALTIQKNGTTVGTYTPNSAKKTINIVVPTKVSELDNDNEYATTSDLDSRIDTLINGAPAAYDTLKEIADVLAGNVDSIGDIITTLGTKADKAIKISAGTGLSGGGTLEADRTLSLATSGVTAGTYKSVTVDKYGRVTSGTNPTTLAGYGITDAYTSAKVDELLGNYVTLGTTQTITGEKNFTGGLKVNGSPIVYDATNKYWKLEGDLLVTGGVTMFASDSAFTPSTIMDAIATDGTNLKVVNGVLTFVGSIDGGEAGSVAWENVTGKPSFASVATSGKYSDLSGVPTLLSSFTDDVVAGKYLPLSGGKLSTKSNIVLTLDASTMGDQNYLQFYNVNYSLGYLGFSAKDNPVYRTSSGTNYKLWHSGNFTPSNYLLASSYTASDILTKLKTVDGEGSGLESEMTYLFKTVWAASPSTTIDLNEWISGGFIWAYGHTGNVLNKPDGVTYCAAIEFGKKGYNSLIGQFLWNVNHNSETDTTKNLYFRASDTNGFLHSQWHTIAFTDSNVASATKLQTARTIWGQSFDGTADVSGDLLVGDGDIYLRNGKAIRAYPTSGSSIRLLRISTSNNIAVGSATYNTYLDGENLYFRYGNGTVGIILNSSGNVGIGTTNPSYKLDVVGDIRSTTNVRTPIATIDGIPIYKSQDDVLYIDGNLAVRGGITMYATDAIDVPSIIDSLPVASTSAKGLASFDPNFFSVDDNGNVSFIGSTGITEVNWTDVVGRPTLLSSFINDQGFASTLGELSNVGSWADSVPTQGRLLYQDAGSSEWSYINLSSLSQAAADVKKLSSWYGVSEDNNMLNRPTTANTIWVDKSLRYYLATSAMTTGKPEADGYILHFSWDNAGWNSQLYIPNSSIRPIQLRTPIADQATTWSEWFSVLDSRGGTINGSLSIQSIKIHDTNVIDGIDNRNLWLNYYSSGAVCLCKGGGNVGIGVDNGNKATEKITILNSTENTNTFVYCKREDTGYGLSFGIGSGGINRGIWDDYFGKWILYTDTSGVNLTQDVWLGQDGWGNGLYLNRKTSGGGAAVTICSVGKIIGRFGISGSRSFQVSMSSSLTAEDDMLKFQVDASGNGLFYGGITMYSDIRKKTKLQDVELTLQQIADAPLIEHYYNSDSNKTTHVGSIAQYWAGMNDWFCKLDGEGFYTMEIQNAALASAISIARELVKYESKTDKEIRLLKDEVKRLKKEIKILKSA